MIHKLRESVWRFRQGRHHAPRLERPVLDLVDFGGVSSTVLDVGANLGGFASQVLVRAPLMTVHCFEPNQELVHELNQKATRWGKYGGKPRAIINPVGVGSVNEIKELIVTDMHAASSFLPTSKASEDGWPMVNFGEARREKVQIVRLDDYFSLART